jgi:hypothetical protein
MVIAWQTVNAIHGRRNYSDAFLVVCPDITIGDRLRVLLPSNPENYYKSRGLVLSSCARPFRCPNLPERYCKAAARWAVRSCSR